MLKSTLLMALVFVYITNLKAQLKDYNTVENFIFFTTKIDVGNNANANIDSIYYYKSEENNLKISYRIFNSNWNATGLPLEQYKECYDHENDTWEKFSKFTYEYHENQQLKSVDEYLWNETENDWILDMNNSYDDEGRLVQTYKISGNLTIAGNIDIYKYDEDGKLLSKTVKLRNQETESWTINREIVFEYENENIIEVNEYSYIFSLDPVLSYRHVFGYNESDQLIKYVCYEMSNEYEGDEVKRVDYEYDELDNNVSRTEVIYDYILFEYRNDKAYTLNYDENQRIINYQIEEWEIENEEWYLDFSEEFEYDENDLIISKTQSHWDAETQVCTLKHKNVKEFNDNNQLVRLYYQNYDFENEEWTDNAQDLYFYYDFLEVSDLQEWSASEEAWLSFEMDTTKFNENHEITYYAKYNLSDNDDMICTYKAEYFYRTTNAIEQLNNNNKLVIAPNIISDQLTINNCLNCNITIYNMHGAQIMKTKTESNTIDVRHLCKGLYLIQAENGYAGKFLKK